MAMIKITQVKSRIGSNKRQRATLDTLGLRRINHTVELEGTPVVLGMVEKVKHLVRIEQ
ncbi:MAG: 50S ribosomal protein L30 [Bacteroidales bacterium]|jgi:large subunit ribosomal protein L30|nr:50S ribosomal protein L30 [Bacteroidales bacterium]MDY0196710.1 50S ribosomal protein L30 [Tenuifilaceae bacterium]